MGRLISEKYAAWQAECEERFQQLKKNEEELNRIFIDIYGLQDELTPDVADKDITVHRVFDSKDDVPEAMKGSNYVRTMRDEIVSLISYAVGCMFGRYSLDVDGLAYAGGEWDASKYKTIIPDNDSTFNYIVGMLYTCAFQSLYYQADKVHQGALPVPVRMMMDEFCNVSLPDDFGKLQATMRSRNIMSTIVLQNISALKALFKDDWEGLIGNADTLLYLGGNEVSTFKYISELLGKETLDTRTRSVSKGRSGSSSVNYQQTGRELMTPDEVRVLDNDHCILFIRGELPVMDRKYDILKHPGLKLTEDGGAAPYIHRPGLTYALEDLPLSTDSWESIEIIE